MSGIVPPDRCSDRLYARAQGVLSIAMLIAVLAVLPAQAQRAGSSVASRPHEEVWTENHCAAAVTAPGLRGQSRTRVAAAWQTGDCGNVTTPQDSSRILHGRRSKND